MFKIVLNCILHNDLIHPAMTITFHQLYFDILDVCTWWKSFGRFYYERKKRLWKKSMLPGVHILENNPGPQ